LNAYVVGAYREIDSHRIFPDAQMHDAWPIMRRGLIEAGLAEVALAYPGLEVSVQKNPAGTSNFVRIDAGPVIITESKVDSADDIPRPAVHREGLAQANVPFLPGMEDLAQPNSPDAKLWTMIVHAPDSDDPTRPAFIDAVFPTPDGKGYLGPRIHLLPLINSDAEEERVEDDLPIEFRDDIAGEEEA
jgi:hypothetical protein